MTPSKHMPLLGWAVGAVFFFYAWVLRVTPSVIVEELMRDLAVTGAVLGHLSALYFYGYAGMQIPAGLLLDRFGPRRLMTVAAAVCVIGCVVFATSGTLGTASVGRLLIGIGSAFSLVGALAVAGQWFPRRRFALLSGLAMMAGMAGGVFGQAPLSLAVNASGWRMTVLLTAAAGALVMIAAWVLVRDRNTGSGGVGAVMAGLKQVVGNRQTWLNAGAGLGVTGPLLGFAALWGVPYLQAAHGVDRSTAGSVTSMVFIGWGVGAPVVGWLSDRIGQRRAPFLFGIALCGTSLGALIYVPGWSLASAALLCLLLGLGGSAQIVSFALVRELNPGHLSGTAVGVLNAAVTGAGALFQPIIGALLDLGWNGELIDGARVYSLAAYQAGLSVLVGGCVASLLCVLAIDERSVQ